MYTTKVEEDRPIETNSNDIYILFSVLNNLSNKKMYVCVCVSGSGAASAKGI